VSLLRSSKLDGAGGAMSFFQPVLAIYICPPIHSKCVLSNVSYQLKYSPLRPRSVADTCNTLGLSCLLLSSEGTMS